MSYTYMETEQEGQGRQEGEGHSDIFSYASLPLCLSLNPQCNPLSSLPPLPPGLCTHISAHGLLAAAA